ncbi:uncharacterized protein LOC132298967 [Cornus florida]|uniref:uncharacterized protein LOC132298967 n=1 Tax=Cornus florida TaxID=4283 RepID=UPI00289C8F44|nr:uncharacterized protein LOC132298967 [Cornus florida]XP_059651342.1 uncharacterized protein LOC132298967 [Cornus florida]
MSFENEDQSSPDKPSETICESQKHSKISYTRNFLLSLSELEICKSLPSGFDQSILSEFEDSFRGIQDRQRIPGSLPLQGFRRNEYGSSPPTRGDSISFSRGVYGRWDSRSSVQNDRDGDSHSDRDSDSGRRYGNQPRRSWQSSEHDGLLGSGSFPRPSGYAAPGVSTSKVRAGDNYQLNRSNEPYHPPRPYKAGPHSRRDTDSFNDETFGSTDCTSQDREEEERRRRASFELMRKEQQKALQEKQKLKPDNQKNDPVSEFSALLEDTKDEKGLLNKNVESDEPEMLQVLNNDSGKSSFPSRTPASRPLVPPGFTSTILDGNSGMKSLIHTGPAEVGGPEIEENLSHSKTNPVQNGTLDNHEEINSAKGLDLSEKAQENRSLLSPFVNKDERDVNYSSALQVSNKKLGIDDKLYQTSSVSEAHESLNIGEVIEVDAEKVTGHKFLGDSNQDHSTSILEKLFGGALTVNIGGSSGVIERHDSKPDETWSPSTVQSSKFAHWFLEDENKPADELSSGRSSDLLSLIGGGGKGGSQVTDVIATQQIPPDFPFQSSEFSNRNMVSNITSATTEISEQLNICSKQEAIPSVLTCEDLEQTILSEFTENSTTSQQPVQGWTVTGSKIEQPKADIDNQASQHLLSLLQKGTGLKDVTPPPTLDTESSDRLHLFDVENIGSENDIPIGANSENIHNSGKTLTLETLFGTAFMKELQSAEAPVSVQRGSAGSARIDVLNDGLFPSSVGDIGHNRAGYESNVLASDHRQKTKPDKIENWLGFNDPQIEVDQSNIRTEVPSKHGGFDKAIEIQLPEEESLITVGDPVKSSHAIIMPTVNSTIGELLSSNTPAIVAEKLAALNTILKDERSMVGLEGQPFVHVPYDMMEPENPYRSLHAPESSPQFRPQMNHGRPSFHPLDSHPAHVNSQMKFMAPESIIRHDAAPNHPFPANMLRPPFHHSTTGLMGFDPLSQHPMLQQMQMSGSFPPPHLLREFPRGAPLPPQSSKQAVGLMQEPNTIQGFPFGHQQPNFGGLGMQLPAPDASVGSNHPEAFQRLMEMELRANSKQIHPLAAPGRSQGMYGHELDMGFRYR